MDKEIQESILKKNLYYVIHYDDGTIKNVYYNSEKTMKEKEIEMHKETIQQILKDNIWFIDYNEDKIFLYIYAQTKDIVDELLKDFRKQYSNIDIDIKEMNVPKQIRSNKSSNIGHMINYWRKCVIF
jgi:hypothetical protein